MTQVTVFIVNFLCCLRGRTTRKACQKHTGKEKRDTNARWYCHRVPLSARGKRERVRERARERERE